nr:MAG TPA: hypothetical protein [Caudoviricetes sp.]
MALMTLEVTSLCISGSFNFGIVSCFFQIVKLGKKMSTGKFLPFFFDYVFLKFYVFILLMY